VSLRARPPIEVIGATFKTSRACLTSTPAVSFAQIAANQPVPRNQPEAVMRLLSHQVTAGVSESVLAMQGARGLTMAETWISIRDTMAN
jgi:hypothetical protein